MLELEGLMIKIFNYVKKRDIKFHVIDVDLWWSKRLRHYFYYVKNKEEPLQLQYLSWNYKEFIDDVVRDSYEVNLMDVLVCSFYMKQTFHRDVFKIWETNYLKKVRWFQNYIGKEAGDNYLTAYLNLTAYILSLLHIYILQNKFSTWSESAETDSPERVINDFWIFLEHYIQLIVDEKVLDLLHIEKISRYELWYHHYTFTGIIWTFLDWNYMRLKKCFKPELGKDV